MLDLEMLTPGSTPELVAALRRMTPSSRLLAGGTDLVREMNEGSLAPDLIVDLSGVRELRFISEEAGHLRVGAATTLTEIYRDTAVRQFARCLAEAAGKVGSVQIRNIATIGGNIGNASPCGDTLPALIALGAVAKIIDGTGEESERPVAEILVGQGRTSLRRDEVITEIRFPGVLPGERSAFAKLGSRSTVSVARLSMAVVAAYDAASNRVSNAKVALGAVGETAYRDGQLERFLEGRVADAESAERFADECTAAIRRSIPGRYSLPYKQSAVRGLAYDVWGGLGFAS
jgi:xanthine dehydrogenase FAD-binding subunit